MKNGKNPKPRKKILPAKPFVYKTAEKIHLDKPEQRNEVLFFDVLESRRSSKEFSQISLGQISELLWHSAKVHQATLSKDGLILTKTNAPSAGALHPIDVFISPANDFNYRSLYYYNPFDHSLEKLELNAACLKNFLSHINESMELKNSCLVWFGMDFHRTNAVYENPESLLWRDAGALVMTFQLVCHAMTMNSCPVGTLAEPFFSDLFQSYSMQSAGGIVVG